MGIPGLWKIIGPSIDTCNFAQLALEKGFRAKEGCSDRMYRVGIDANIFLNQAQTVYLRRHAQAGVNPELRQLMYRLANLSKLALTPIFVFDGPGRPHIKRGTNVIFKDHWLAEPFRELISAFGFHSHQAPGEAEAELAHLNHIGAVDAVMTNDSDVLVFGATTIIKIPNSKEDGETVSLVTSESMQASPVSLTRGGLLLVALLIGGDYHEGIPGCGPQVSHGLAKAGLGDDLLTASNTLVTHSLASFLSDWRLRLQAELQHDVSGMLHRHYAQLADAIPPDFPNPDIIQLYTRPLTSATHNMAIPYQGWILRQPDIKCIVALCELHFGWDSLPVLEKRLGARLLEGLVLRMLLKPVDIHQVVLDYHTDRPSSELDRGMVVKIVNYSCIQSVYSVQIATNRLHSLIESGIRNLRGHHNSPNNTKASPKRIKVAACILENALPRMVQQYHPKGRKPQRQYMHERASQTLGKREFIDLTDD
ncbi:XPG/Rad2 endonuclease [Pleurotus pulmonarius]|nr:hypothetical protein EYR38_010709 [Pleurotus pulmonarius]